MEKKGYDYMNQKQKIIKMIIIITILILTVIGGILIIQFRGTQEKKVEVPKVETPLSEIPTLDPSLSNEQKAIQIILNRTTLKAKDLKYIEQTTDGQYMVNNLKETTKKEKVYYLVDIKTESYQRVVTISKGTE